MQCRRLPCFDRAVCGRLRGGTTKSMGTIPIDWFGSIASPSGIDGGLSISAMAVSDGGRVVVQYVAKGQKPP